MHGAKRLTLLLEREVLLSVVLSGLRNALQRVCGQCVNSVTNWSKQLIGATVYC